MDEFFKKLVAIVTEPEVSMPLMPSVGSYLLNTEAYRLNAQSNNAPYRPY